MKQHVLNKWNCSTKSKPI